MGKNTEVGIEEIKSLVPVVPRSKHEHWVKAAIPTARVEVLDNEHPIVNRLKCDLVFRVNEADPLWAEVGEYIAQREVIFEHHSNSISRDNLIGCVIKQASYTRDRRIQGLSDRERSPCLVMSSFRYPRKMLKSSDFRSTGTRGIYIDGGSDTLLILIVTSQLPKDSKYNFLRLLSRAPDPNSIDHIEESLMEIRDLTRLEKEGLQEVAMSLRTQSQTVIKKLAKQWVAMEIDIEEKEALIEQRDEALHQMNEALHQKDEALHQKDEALHQKDEALQALLSENERLKKLLEKQ